MKKIIKEQANKQYNIRFSGGNCQTGAVMAEFIIITSLVMVPLFFGITLIGKYTDNQQKLEVAARYASWERTVWYQKLPGTLKDIGGIDTIKSAEKIGFEVQNRVFSHKDTGIYLAQNDAKTEENKDQMSELHWVKGTKKQTSIYEMKDKTTSFITATETPKDAYGMSVKGLKLFFELIGKVSSLDLNLAGAYESKVNVTLAKPLLFEDVFDDKVAIERTSTILTDGWNAAGPAHARQRVKGTVILDLFDTGLLNKVRDGLAWTPIAKEIGSKSLKFGHVVVDAVPKTRLERYKTK